MANWRKQQGASHHQVGHWNRSYNRKPPLDNWQQSTIPSWEKKFCATIGLVSWRKLLETQKYMYLHDNVLNWDDSAGREAFDNAKKRFWSEINGLPCNISLPDPDIYIDDIDWNSSVDPELLLDLEREPKDPSEEGSDEVVILGSSLLLNQSFSCTGWGEAEMDLPKADNPFPGPQGWESNLPVNSEPDPWEQYWVPDEPANQYGWQNYGNDSWGWNETEHKGSDLQKMGRGRGSGNWGTWDGYERRRDNISWNKTSAYHGNDYQMGRGRRNNRGRERKRGGNLAYECPYADNIPSAREMKIK